MRRRATRRSRRGARTLRDLLLRAPRRGPLRAEEERRFRANAAAWAYFEGRPAGYRRIATHWVVSAKRPETRTRRFVQLVEDSANGLLIKSQRRP